MKHFVEIDHILTAEKKLSNPQYSWFWVYFFILFIFYLFNGRLELLQPGDMTLQGITKN